MWIVSQQWSTASGTLPTDDPSVAALTRVRAIGERSGRSGKTKSICSDIGAIADIIRDGEWMFIGIARIQYCRAFGSHSGDNMCAEDFKRPVFREVECHDFAPNLDIGRHPRARLQS